MNVVEITYCGKIALLDVRKSGLLQMGKAKLCTVIDKLRKQAVPGVIVDLSHMGQISFSDLGKLIEIFAKLGRERTAADKGIIAAICGLSEQSKQRLKRHELLDLLPNFPSRAAALQDDMFRALKLVGTGAILLCAPKGSRMRPLTCETPVPMLDFLGQPIITRIMDHLIGFGITDFVVNTGYCGQKVRAHLKTREGVAKFFVDDSSMTANNGAQLSLAARLSHLSHHHSVFEEDRFVLSGNALTNVNLNEMMAFHRSVQADVTIAVCDEASMNTGVMILGPAAQDILSGPNCTGDMIEFFQKRGARVRLFISEHQWLPIRCGAEYFNAHKAVLQNLPEKFAVSSVQKEKNLWVEPTAQLGRRLAVDGCSYIGAGARVASDVMLTGNCVIGANCRVLPKSLLNNSLICADTQVEKSTIVDHMIAGPNWAINHSFADGRLQNRSPIEGLKAVIGTQNDRLGIVNHAVKIA